MSDPSVSEPSRPGSSKKPISPARKIIGAVALVALVGVAWLEYSALLGYNSAVRRFQARSEDESKDLMTVQEAETLIGKSPDGPGTDFDYVVQTFMKIPEILTKKEYTCARSIQVTQIDSFLHQVKECQSTSLRDRGRSGRVGTGPTGA